MASPILPLWPEERGKGGWARIESCVGREPFCLEGKKKREGEQRRAGGRLITAKPPKPVWAFEKGKRGRKKEKVRLKVIDIAAPRSRGKKRGRGKKERRGSRGGSRDVGYLSHAQAGREGGRFMWSFLRSLEEGGREKREERKLKGRGSV